MRSSRTIVALVAALLMAVAPGLALARAGSGASMGSRGGMTYSAPPSTNTAPYSAQPMQRSMTQPNQGYSAPPGAGYGGFNQPARSGFMSGLMGGLIGAGIGGLLLGHGFFGGGLGFGGFFGFLIQIFLLVLLVRFLIRLFTGNRGPAVASGPSLFARGGMPGAAPMSAPGGLAPPPPVAIAPAD